MNTPWREACLFLTLFGLPTGFVAFCLGLSRRRQGWVTSYVAYYFLFGCIGQWLLVFTLSPSGVGQTLSFGLSTAAPAMCLGLAVALQKLPSRAPFDTGALIACYLYPALVVAGVAITRWLPSAG